jgi:NADH-ubiquinone oxidoreductase chain 6
MKTLFINLLAFGTLLSSILTITAKNPVISVIFLITTFVAAAGYLILIGIQFLGLSYIVIYVGAIAVLFLFVIMMINIKLTDILETGSQYTKNLPLAIIIAFLFLFTVFTIIPLNLYNVPSLSISLLNNLNILFLNLNSSSTWEAASNLMGGQITDTFFTNIISPISGIGSDFDNLAISYNDLYVLNFQQIEVLGHTLYTYGSILLLLLSFILLLAMFATIVISAPKKS